MLGPFVVRMLRLIAWVFISGVTLLLLWNGEYVFQRLAGTATVERLVHEESTPLAILRSVVKAIRSCDIESQPIIEPSPPNVGGAAVNHPITASDAEQGQELAPDPQYNAWTSREQFAERPFGPNSTRASWQFLECAERSAFEEGAIKNWKRFDDRSLWLFVLLESPPRQAFLVWPAHEIPKSFEPARRPWNWSTVRRDGNHIAKSDDPEIGLPVYVTKPYPDAMSRETVVALVTHENVGGADVTVGVDLRVGAGPTIFPFTLFLNFVMVVCFSAVNAVAFRTMRGPLIRTWYAAWLCLGVLYGCYVIQFLCLEPWSLVQQARQHAAFCIASLSIANSGLFLVVAMQIVSEAGREKWMKGVSWTTGAVLGLIALVHYVPGLPGDRLLWSDCIEVACSAVALSVLGYALGEVILRNASPDTTQQEVMWNRAAVVAVYIFFAMSVGLQVSILFWHSQPYLEGCFWILSVIVKVGLMGLFFKVLLLEKYWDHREIHQIMVDQATEGIVAVGQDLKIIRANDTAAGLLNMARERLRGESLYEALFVSRFDADSVLNELRDKGTTTRRGLATRVHPSGQKKSDLRASLLRDRRRDGAYALVAFCEVSHFLRDGDK